jgi:transcriptional regulator with XRE-family HTH domain
MTQAELAGRAGVSRVHLANVERGRRRPPRRDILQQLVNALELPADSEAAVQLYRQAGYQPPSTPALIPPDYARLIQRLLPKAANGRRDQDSPIELPSREVARRALDRLPDVVDEPEAVLNAALILLGSASDEPGAPPVILSAGIADEVQAVPGARHLLRLAVQKALALGRPFEHLLPAGQDARTLVQRSTEMLSFVNQEGAYRPYLIEQTQSPSLPGDLLIVPESGALLSLKTATGSGAVRVFRDQPSIGLLAGHAAFATANGQPIPLELLVGDEVGQYAASTAAGHDGANLVDGEDDVLFVGRGPALHLVPPEVWNGWTRPLIRHAAPADRPAQRAYLEQLREYQTGLWDAFIREDRFPRSRELYSLEAIREFIRDGRMTEWDRLAPDLPAIPADERAEVMLDMLQWLHSCRQVEIGLLDAYPPELGDLSVTVQGSRRVFLHSSLLSQHRPVTLAIDQPTIAAAFQHYIDELWNALSPRWRDKTRICRWLDGQLDLLSPVGDIG